MKIRKGGGGARMTGTASKPKKWGDMLRRGKGILTSAHGEEDLLTLRGALGVLRWKVSK